MNKLSKTILISALFQLLMASNAVAQISVDRVIVNFPPNKRPLQNIVIRNNGKELMGIDIVAERVVNPGEKNEKRIATDELIVSPKRLSIRGRNQRTARLLLKKLDRNIEHVFRIKLLPKAGGFDREPSGETKDKKTMLKVLTSVGLLVFVDPIKKDAKLSWKRKKNTLIFKNEGNTNIYLDEGKACIRPDVECEELPSTRTYAGNTWEIDIPQGKNHITFRKKVGEEFETFIVE